MKRTMKTRIAVMGLATILCITECAPACAREADTKAEGQSVAVKEENLNAEGQSVAVKEENIDAEGYVVHVEDDSFDKLKEKYGEEPDGGHRSI